MSSSPINKKHHDDRASEHATSSTLYPIDKPFTNMQAWVLGLFWASVLTILGYHYFVSLVVSRSSHWWLLTPLALIFFPVLCTVRVFAGKARLQARLVSAFLLISLVPVGFLSMLDQHVTSQALVENSRQGMEHTLTQAAAALDHFIDANLSTIRTEAMIPQFSRLLELPPSRRDNSLEEHDVMSILMSLKRRDEVGITSVALLDRNGVTVADTFGPELGSIKKNREYFKRPMETGLPYVSNVGITEWSQRPATYFSCPVRNVDGDIVGVLRVRYNASVLVQVLGVNKEKSASKFKLVLFDEYGIRLADTAKPSLILTPAFPLDEEVVRTLRSSRRLLENVDVPPPDGVTLDSLKTTAPAFFRASLHGWGDDVTLNVKTRIQSKPWTLVLGYSEAENEARIDTQMRTALFLVLGMTLAVILGSFFVSRSITGPVQRLTDAAQAISKGEDGEIAPIHTGDEIEELASTFNSMSQALRVSRERLLASGERLQSLLDTLPDSVLIHEEDGTIVDVNRSFTHMFGFSPEEARSLSIESISGAGFTQEEGLRCLESAISQGYVMYEWTSKRKNGQEFFSQIRLRRLYLSEGIRIMVVLSDITAQKQAEQAMLRAQEELEHKVAVRTHELVEANKQLLHLDELKNAFIASASHELRTPLTSVLGFAKITAKQFGKHIIPAIQTDSALLKRGQFLLENLRIIENEGSRLARLINDLLDLNKIESGKCEWRNELVSLPDEVVLAVRTMDAEFQHKPDIRMVIDVENDIPQILIDRDRIRQVFLNLLSNALKFTSSGIVCFSLKREESRQKILGAIKDSGAGIPPEDLERVFDKFYQVPPLEPGQTKAKGTGLGLSICRQIIEHYGGRIWVESELGKGTIISFVLPVTHLDASTLPSQDKHAVFT